MLEKILDIIFPKVCINCGKQGEGIICTSCFSSLNLENKIKREYGKQYDYMVYLNKYEGKMRSKLLKYKFYDSAYMSEYFVELIVRNIKICNFLKKFDLIIPVPMHKEKRLKRGYNQTELITKKLSEKLEIAHSTKILKRIKLGKTQSLLNKNDRMKNVSNAFALGENVKDNLENRLVNKLKFRKSLEIKGKNIILFDDIFTTGATVEFCSKILKEAGVNKICVLVICKD